MRHHHSVCAVLLLCSCTNRWRRAAVTLRRHDVIAPGTASSGIGRFAAIKYALVNHVANSSQFPNKIIPSASCAGASFAACTSAYAHALAGVDGLGGEGNKLAA